MASGKNFIDLLHTNINQYKVLITNKDLISTQVIHSLQGAEMPRKIALKAMLFLLASEHSTSLHKSLTTNFIQE